MNEIDKSTVRRFREYIRHAERELDIQNESCCTDGITLRQCHALMEISQRETLSLGELTDRLYLDKSTVSRTVEGLVRDNLVNRNIPGNNRRKVDISLTKQGEAVCDRINRDNDDFFSEALQSVPAEDLPVFLRSFELMVDQMIRSNRLKKSQC